MIATNKKGSMNFMVPLAKEEDFEEAMLSKKSRKIHNLARILKLTGLYFGNKEDGMSWHYFGMVRAFIVCCLSIYQTCFAAYYLVTRVQDEKTPIYIFILSWNIQATLTIIFMIYWQLKGHFSILFSMLKWPSSRNPAYQPTRRSIKFVLIIFLLFLMFMLCNFTFVTYNLVIKNTKWLLLDMSFFEQIYPSPYLSGVAMMVVLFNYLNWMVGLNFYMIVCYILHGEFMKFNHELKQVGHKNFDSQTRSDQLLVKYTEHIKLAKLVRLVDSTFEVYAFVMIGLNIPTTIFSLISCFTAPTSEKLILLLPSPFLCILQLLGLTSVPAKVHTAIQEVRNILYSNTNIWKPFSEKTYQIASVFVSHVDQANLGISVWGFAIVTKPLILTTVSLTITYLTILLQLQINHQNRANFENLTNSTM